MAEIRMTPEELREKAQAMKNIIENLESLFSQLENIINHDFYDQWNDETIQTFCGDFNNRKGAVNDLLLLCKGYLSYIEKIQDMYESYEAEITNCFDLDKRLND